MYGREAFSEWGKALRYGGRAIAARLPGYGGAEKGGRLGDVADAALARFGKPGKLASKVHLGSRLVERAGVGGGNAGAGGGGNGGNGASAAVPFPIQESIDVALPVGGAFALASRFLDFPGYLDRMSEAEEVDETHFAFVVRTGRRSREVEVEIVEESPDSRIEWECDGELSHAGVLTFHPLAPRLTRLELTIEREPDGLPERFWRRTHLAGRAIQAELHRFKAHVELLDEDFEDYVPVVEEEEELEPA